MGSISLFGGDFKVELGAWAMRPPGKMSGLLTGITFETSKDLSKRNLRCRPEWGNHN
jgi:hypothetical protein